MTQYGHGSKTKSSPQVNIPIQPLKYFVVFIMGGDSPKMGSQNGLTTTAIPKLQLVLCLGLSAAGSASFKPLVLLDRVFHRKETDLSM